MPPPGFELTAKGLRDRNSPTCTLSQNGYGARKRRRTEGAQAGPVWEFKRLRCQKDAPQRRGARRFCFGDQVLRVPREARQGRQTVLSEQLKWVEGRGRRSARRGVSSVPSRVCVRAQRSAALPSLRVCVRVGERTRPRSWSTEHSTQLIQFGALVVRVCLAYWLPDRKCRVGAQRRAFCVQSAQEDETTAGRRRSCPYSTQKLI